MFRSQLNQLIKFIENNTWITALLILVSNLEYKHIRKDIGQETCDHLLEHWMIRKLILFSLIFTSTRDLRVSIWVTLIYTILVHSDLIKND